jgi:hypothetical protein
VEFRHTHLAPFRRIIPHFLLFVLLLLTLVANGQIKRHAGNLQSSATVNDAQSGFFPGAINIFAGNGTANGGYADGSLPTNVSIGSPTAVASDSQGDIFFAGDSGNTIFVVYEGGQVPPILAAVTTQASPAVTPMKGDIYQVSAVTSNCNYCYTDGIPAAQAYLNNIQGMSFDSSDNLYIAAGQNMYCVFEVDHSTTQLHVVAGEFDLVSSYSPGDTIDGVPATSVALSAPTDVKTDSFGNIYISDEGNVVALVVYAGSEPPPVLAAEGIVTSSSDKGNIYTIAGQVQNFCSGPGTCTDAGPARGSLISGAISLSVDGSGNVYVLDNYAYTVRAIYAGGTIPSLLNTVNDLQNGSIYTIAGLNTQFTPCSAANCGDGGNAANILFNSPLYLAVDAGGNVYIDDALDHAVRKVDASGNVSTIAGIADPNAIPPAVPSGGGAATSTPLNLPSTIAFDPQNNLYIADSIYDIVWSVGPALPQSITFPKLDNPVTYGEGQVPLSATASSGLAVQYFVTGPAQVSGTGSSAELNLTGAGTVTVTAKQPGNAEYASATPITQSIIVNKAPLTVTAVDATKQHGQPNPAFSATYIGFVDGDTQAIALTGHPSITTTATTNSDSGTYTLTVSQGTLASNNYQFTFVNGIFTITGATKQSITFTPLTPITYGEQTTIALNASASSGLPVQYTVLSGPGSISGSTLVITGGGTIVITASQSGNNTYAGATPISQNLIVKPAPLTVTAPALSYPYGTAINPTLFPSPSITGFVGSDNASLVSGSAQYATNASGTPHGGAYTLTVTQGTLAIVPQAAANYTLMTFVPGSLTITPAPQTISSLPLPAVSYNTLYSVTASASSGQPVSVATSGPLVIYGSNLTAPGAGNNIVQFYANGVGPATLTLTQTGTSDYAAASPVVLSLNANKAELDIQANNQIQEQGAPNPTFTYTIGANVQPGPLGGFVDVPSIVSGIPVLTTTATPSSLPGTYPIVPGVGTLSSPIYFFKFLNGELTITQSGSFTITANPPSLTIASGMSAQATITITPNNAYQGTVTLSCGKLPANLTCIVSPATYTFPGSQNADGSENPAQGTITINATAGSVVGALSTQDSTTRMAGLFFPGAMLALLLVFARRQASRRSSIWSICFFIMLSLEMISLASCGGSSGSSTINTPPGTSIVTINGSGTTPSGNGSVTASVPLSVTIQ